MDSSTSRRPIAQRAISTVVVRPIQRFLAIEASGGILLVAAAAAALVWANMPGTTYFDTWDTHVGTDLAGLHFDLTLKHWINDALMAVFFFVVGLEIKRELIRGELSDTRRAALPAAAALGGMIVPALIFVAFNAGGEVRGWGIPMATDIAFAVGVMALLGNRVPAALKIFVLALAIVDDIGAITVIALFYTDDIALEWLAGGAAVAAALFIMARLNVSPTWLYLALGVVLWVMVHESGVHATIAGVALGLLIPLRDHDDESEAVPLEEVLHPWTSYLIIPLFALANAGVDLGGGAVGDAMESPVAAGVALGLLIGKPAGILLFSAGAVALGLASLPEGIRWPQIASAGAVAGIGFTVSLFIAELAYDNGGLVDEAKIGILAGSLASAAVGLLALVLTSKETPERQEARLEGEPL